MAKFLEPDGEVLLDPFCGSGTTLYEAAVRGWPKVIGFDANPIAALVSRFKLMAVMPTFFRIAESLVTDMSDSRLSDVRPVVFAFDGRHHWFDKCVLSELAMIVAWIRSQRRRDVRLWLMLSLSRIVNRVSRQESETRYVAVDKEIVSGETFERFRESCATTLDLLRSREPFQSAARLECVNVRAGAPLGDATVDRIVTSPPYCNSMDYYLYHKQRMNILGFDFKAVQNAEIGSRHEYSSLRVGLDKWRTDYTAVLREFRRVLRPSGYAVVIIGDSQIAGARVDAAALTRTAAESLGFDMAVLDSTPLDGRSRSFARGFQRPNKMEHTIRLIARAQRTSRVVSLPETLRRGQHEKIRIAR
ncbi:MAG TPA: hypothetical protein VGD01_18520 [Candidatus Elarobacter sp.]